MGKEIRFPASDQGNHHHALGRECQRAVRSLEFSRCHRDSVWRPALPGTRRGPLASPLQSNITMSEWQLATYKAL